MRNQWRLLLGHRRHSLLSAAPAIPRSRVTFTTYDNEVRFIPSAPPTLSPFSLSSIYPKPSPVRYFSSHPVLEATVLDRYPIVDIFSNSISGDAIKLQLDSNGVVINPLFVLEVLENLRSNPTVAIKFFDWIQEREVQVLSKFSYHLMMEILASNGLVKEFWNMHEIMKKKRYSLNRSVVNCAAKKFAEEGHTSDLQRLKSMYNFGEAISDEICQIIKPGVWDKDTESKIKNLGSEFSTDAVKSVLDRLAPLPAKALAFFQWIEKRHLLKHDEKTYNAMALALSREDSTDRFWNIVHDMTCAGYKLQEETFVKLLNQFTKNQKMKDVISLYELAMATTDLDKSTNRYCTFLLKKLAAAKEFDDDLFSKGVRIVARIKNRIPDTTVKSAVRVLARIGRFEKRHLINDALQGGGVERRPRADHLSWISERPKALGLGYSRIVKNEGEEEEEED